MYIGATDMYRMIPGEGAANFTFNDRILATGSEVPQQAFYDGNVDRLMSTGYYNGDSRQASHWKANELNGNIRIGLMDPTIAPGELVWPTEADLRVLDLIGWDVSPLPDCNANGIPDDYDFFMGTSNDCNLNGIPDECDIDSGFSEDCNTNGWPDSCDLANGWVTDYNLNGIPDVCEPIAAPERLAVDVRIAPNPFNPRTEIQLSLSQDARTSVKIFDLAGRHIATLADRDYDAGQHSVIWEGRDDGGREVSSGVYFVMVEVNGDVQRHKVALVR
jgi:hypothetical protein